jgi:Tripartite tricarboxylate transporter TctB family
VSEQAPAASRRGRMIGRAVLTLIGILALAISFQLGLWRQNSPGEGLFPFLMALAMTAFGAAALARDWTRFEPAQGYLALSLRPALEERRGGRIRVAAYLGALVFYAGTLEILGFIVATAIAITFILRCAEHYSWRATLALTAGTIIGCQVLFVVWLGAILPVGTLWDFG